MYLKKIEIQGFKSFADRTTIEFKDDISAIVGPNGSGKSNISDAIRWVLGEQSVKSLRGNKMEDVIFSGTDKRRALGFAEVTIFLDNTDSSLTVDFSEVAVTRRMFRSGESEYYINKSSCRLKDVRSLFMDTGIGKDGYSIIGQGRIDEVLSNRPEDRRNIFEEAAGIVKYKTKKDETKKKLEKTQENLIRIKDLIYEIQNQYEILENESSKANEFVSLYNELKVLDVNFSIREIDKLRIQMEDLKTEIKLDNKEIESLDINKTGLDNRFNKLKEEIKSIELSYEKFRNDKVDLIQSIESSKSQINLLTEKEKFYNRDIERYNKELNSLNRNIETIDEDIKLLTDNTHNIDIKYTNLQEVYNKKKDEFSYIEGLLREKEASLEYEKDIVLKVYNQISDNKSTLNGIDIFLDNIDKRISQLKDDKKRIEEANSQYKESISDIVKNESKLYKRLAELDKNKGTLTRTKTELSNDYLNISKDINEVELKLHGLSSSYKLYKNMEDGYEGYYKSVKNLLQGIKNNKLDISGFRGVIADLFRVDSKYERAIDISLGSSLQNIVVEDESIAKNMIAYLKSNNLGRVTFLPRNIIRGNILSVDLKELKESGVIDLAHNLIEFDDIYNDIFESLLGKTLIVDNIDNGIKLANRFKHKYRIVTLDGDLLNPGGSLTGGSNNKNTISIIGRKNLISDLEKEIKELNIVSSRLKNQIDEKIKDIENNEGILAALNSESKDLEVSIINNSNEKKLNLKEIDRLDKETIRIDEEICSLEEEDREYQIKRSHCKKSITEYQEKVNFINNNIREINEELSIVKKDKELRNIELTDFQIDLNHIKNELDNLKNNILNKSNEKTEKENSIERLKKDFDFALREINTLKYEEIKLKDSIESISMKQESVSLKLDEYANSKEELMDSFYKEQENLKIINDRMMALEKQKSKREVKLSKLELQEENLKDKLFSDYELTYDMALDLEIYSEEIIISINRINLLRDKIKSLGNVNVGAIEDFKNIKERLEFINKQYGDLIQSKENLEKLIKEMDNTMRELFKSSFEEISENFTKVFSILFNGGKATLELDFEDDVLKSGIEIKVQPPGKKLQNLNLLSGGERSLTAVALLFAILETRPSPFCILDEIDASLDEANLRRYTRYLKKFSHNTQFILITHRKTTMEIADILYGVTMAEEGVSNLLSVKIKDYAGDLVV